MFGITLGELKLILRVELTLPLESILTLVKKMELLMLQLIFRFRLLVQLILHECSQTKHHFEFKVLLTIINYNNSLKINFCHHRPNTH